ncbi:unnamed protein product [Victoria cruziana]
MVYELLRTFTDAPLASTPVWARDFKSQEELNTEFCRECRVVKKGLAGDLKKAMKDGKPIIIEGIHLDPSIYLMDEENGVLTGSLKKDKVPTSVVRASVDKLADSVETVSLGSTGNLSGNSDKLEGHSHNEDSCVKTESISGSHIPKVTEVLAPSDVTGTVPVELVEASCPSAGSRIMAFLSGPATLGPGMVVGENLSQNICTHRDLLQDRAPYITRSYVTFTDGWRRSCVMHL